MSNNIYKPFARKETLTGVEYSIGYYCIDSTAYNAVYQEIDELAAFVPAATAGKALISNVDVTPICLNLEFPCLVDLYAIKADETSSKTQQHADLAIKKTESFSMTEFTVSRDMLAYYSGWSGFLSWQVKYNREFTTTAAVQGNRTYYDMLFNGGLPHKCRLYEVEAYAPASEFERASNRTLYNFYPTGTPNPARWRLESMNVSLVTDHRGKLWTRIVKSYMEAPFDWIIWRNI